MVWTIDAVTLPYGPRRVQYGAPPKTEDFELDGAEPIIIVLAPALSDIVLQGSVISSSESKTDIWTDIISPLLAKRGTVVSIVDTDGIYSNSYFLADFQVVDNSRGSLVRFDYTMTLRDYSDVQSLV